MAIRPVFVINSNPPYYKKIDVEFKYASGFSLTQKQKNINNLHSSLLKSYPKYKILEISTKSMEYLGQSLSAFNLELKINGKAYSVESIYQSSKVFTSGKQYNSILYKSPLEAKKYHNKNDSGMLEKFRFLNIDFPLEPNTYFYNWLYINALVRHKDLLEKLLDGDYNAFSDIEFNPNKSINCQAQAVAICISLIKTDKLFDLYKDNFIDKEFFLKTVYENHFIISSTLNLTNL